MARRDVDGTSETRMLAVLRTCESFVNMLSSSGHQAEDRYSVVSFSQDYTVHCSRVRAPEAHTCFQRALEDIRPGNQTLFSRAFDGIVDVVSPHDHVKVVFLSDGRPHELAKTTKCFERARGLLNNPRTFKVYSIAFGRDFDTGTYLQPLAALTGGTFQVAGHSTVDLHRVFSSVSSSITATRTSVPLAGIPSRVNRSCTSDARTLLFDPSGPLSGEVEMLTTRSRFKCRWTRGQSIPIFEEVIVHRRAHARVEQVAFEEGAMRRVYKMSDSTEHNEMVAKMVKERRENIDETMCIFCKNTCIAVMAVQAFRQEVGRTGIRCPNIYFVPVYLYRATDSPRQQTFVGERFLSGSNSGGFVKYNGNNGFVDEQVPHSEVLQAFSHFTFIWSRRKLIVVDLQGILDNHTVLLTDPQVLSRERAFGIGDLGLEGFAMFARTHRCGPTCLQFGLRSLVV